MGLYTDFTVAAMSYILRPFSILYSGSFMSLNSSDYVPIYPNSTTILCLHRG